ASQLERYADDLGRLFEKDIEALREQLLAIHGIGPETADSIILYAANRPSFVIDAYTQRILRRLDLAPAGNRYDDFRAWMQDHLPRDVQMYNEYHALLVHLGKYWCRKRDPRCGSCPLLEMCPTGAKGKEAN